MTSVADKVVFIPEQACVLTVPVHSLPSSITKKMWACPVRSDRPAVFISPVELREKGTAHEPSPLTPGQFFLPVMTSNSRAFRILRDFLHSPENSLPRPGENSLRHPGENSLPRPGENSLRHPGENSLPRPGENSLPRPGENSLRHPGENSLPRPGENSLPRPGENSLRHPGENSLRRPAENSLRRPGENSLPRPAENSLRRPAENSLPRPAENSLRRPAENSLPRPAENSLPRPAENSLPRPAENSLRRPAENSLPRPAENSLRRPAENSLPRPAENSLPRPAENSLPRPAENSLPRPAENSLPRPAENSLPRPGENSLRRPAENSLPRPGENSLRRPGENSLPRPGKNSLRRPGENSLPRPAENSLRRPGENSLRRPGENSLQRPGENSLRAPGENSLRRPGENPQACSAFSKRKNAIVLFDTKIFLILREAKAPDCLLEKPSPASPEREAPPPNSQSKTDDDITDRKRSGDGADAAEDHGKCALEEREPDVMMDRANKPMKEVSTNTPRAGNHLTKLEEEVEEVEEEEQRRDLETRSAAETQKGKEKRSSDNEDEMKTSEEKSSVAKPTCCKRLLFTGAQSSSGTDANERRDKSEVKGQTCDSASVSAEEIIDVNADDRGSQDNTEDANKETENSKSHVSVRPGKGQRSHKESAAEIIDISDDDDHSSGGENAVGTSASQVEKLLERCEILKRRISDCVKLQVSSLKCNKASHDVAMETGADHNDLIIVDESNQNPSSGKHQGKGADSKREGCVSAVQILDLDDDQVSLESPNSKAEQRACPSEAEKRACPSEAEQRACPSEVGQRACPSAPGESVVKILDQSDDDEVIITDTEFRNSHGPQIGGKANGCKRRISGGTTEETDSGVATKRSKPEEKPSESAVDAKSQVKNHTGDVEIIEVDDDDDDDEITELPTESLTTLEIIKSCKRDVSESHRSDGLKVGVESDVEDQRIDAEDASDGHFKRSPGADVNQAKGLLQLMRVQDHDQDLSEDDAESNHDINKTLAEGPVSKVQSSDQNKNVATATTRVNAMKQKVTDDERSNKSHVPEVQSERASETENDVWVQLSAAEDPACEGPQAADVLDSSALFEHSEFEEETSEATNQSSRDEGAGVWLLPASPQVGHAVDYDMLRRQENISWTREKLKRFEEKLNSLKNPQH
ncbi:uncharacterized protein si:dkeyp-110g5.4 isoform X2 [Tachysurus fulvidraco]|uniref:uncharacterized protein si:dkeyp-110g5.4 isoform X2 n=1 Tax=Tachysurus fulvidraco TaxID=1234273 RepID=UPI001FEFC356|nr:uncharacterized protein si:dkeyp-110g5.4 isoform X2 [Tachysurus fulvidraco]